MSPTLDRRRAIASFAGIGIASAASMRSATAQATPTLELAPATEVDGTSIIVTVTGAASAPADYVIAQIVIRAGFSDVPLDYSQSPEGIGSPLVVTRGDVDAVAAVLIENGVDQTQVLTSAAEAGIGGGYFGPGTGIVVFQLDGEQIKTLPLLLAAATDAVTGLGYMFDQPGAMYLARSCQDQRAEAYANAVQVGREEAQLLATALGVEIEGLKQARKLAVSFGPAAYSVSSSDSCGDLVDLGSAIRTYLPPFDVSITSEFIVYAMLELTFRIV